MSSLAATQADGYYLPLEYYESGAYKKKSKNQWQKQDKTKSSHTDDNISHNIVRFELADDAVCDHCQHYIKRGTRYNATKIDTHEAYFTTTIWEFRMRCRNCRREFSVRTDPRNRGFAYGPGIRRKIIEPDDANEVSTIGEPKTALERLESTQLGQRKAQGTYEELQQLHRRSQSLYLNDYETNATLRKTFRIDRKERKRRLKEGADRGWRSGMALLDGTVQDACLAQSLTYGNGKRQEQQRWSSVRKSRIFENRKRSSVVKTNPRPDDPVRSCMAIKLEGSEATSPKQKRKIVLHSNADPAPKQQLSALDVIAAYESDSSSY